MVILHLYIKRYLVVANMLTNKLFCKCAYNMLANIFTSRELPSAWRGHGGCSS